MAPYRPIETIPDEVKQKGDEVLLKDENGNVCIGWWNRLGRYWDRGFALRAKPVSWHPLPSDTDTSEVERLREEVERLRALLTPQPIETAPKNGTRILGYDASFEDSCSEAPWQPVFWSESLYQACEVPPSWLSSDYNHEERRPTHWLPIPRRPLLSQGGR